jgi:hypothetical protein
VYPQLYLGQIPTTAPARRALRERALDLHAALRAARAPEPTYALLNFAVDAGPGPAATPHEVELLLLRPNAVIVGAIREYAGPIEVSPGGHWLQSATGAAIHDERGRTPLQVVDEQRDAVRERLDQESARLLDGPADARPFERTVAALICAPAIHPESRISLDVDEHRRWLKVLGLDELPGLAAMVRSGVRLSEDAMRQIATEVFEGRLWHDGERLLFHLAPDRFQLRLLAEGDRAEVVRPLMEGENIVGRRRAAQRYERRVTLAGDDLVSSDHARIICGDDDQVILRDISKNGTGITLPDGSEELVHRAERVLAPGAMLRMGVTRMRLERIGDSG